MESLEGNAGLADTHRGAHGNLSHPTGDLPDPAGGIDDTKNVPVLPGFKGLDLAPGAVKRVPPIMNLYFTAGDTGRMWWGWGTGTGTCVCQKLPRDLGRWT